MEMDLETIRRIYKKTLGYQLERVVVNNDGTTTHLHSDKFLDEHPERRESPEFTEEEEKEQLMRLWSLVQVLNKPKKLN